MAFHGGEIARMVINTLKKSNVQICLVGETKKKTPRESTSAVNGLRPGEYRLPYSCINHN